MDSEKYLEWLRSLGEPKTSDDCYTPAGVYEIVKDWVVSEYGLEGRPIVRPFYPSGDYRAYDYPEECVVIDNPPFSISGEIKDFYVEKGIDFFLFADHLTLFSRKKHEGVSYVVTGSRVVYDNGKNVNTSFVTSLERGKIRLAPDLKKKIDEFSRGGGYEKLGISIS